MFQRNFINGQLRRSLFGALVLISLLTLATPALHAQSTSKSAKTEKARKLVRKVAPVYPNDLKRLNIGGTVKLDLQISARGSVERISVVGGNPILAESATRAVKQWQYEAADAPSTMLLNVEFNPRQ